MKNHIKDIICSFCVAYSIASFITWTVLDMSQLESVERGGFLWFVFMIFVCFKVWRI